MPRSIVPSLLLLLIVPGCRTSPAYGPPCAGRPDIVPFFVDDLGWQNTYEGTRAGA